MADGEDQKRQATEIAICRKVLLMVSELHVRGFQCLRIAPGESPSGRSWRCSITPVTNILARHGAQLVDWDHWPPITAAANAMPISGGRTAGT